MNITIEQLKNYLGTELEMGMMDYQSDYVNKKIDTIIGLHQWDKSGSLWSVLTEGGSKPNPDRVKPICYRLTDLGKFIPELGFIPLQELFQIAYESIYNGRFDGEFDNDPLLSENLAVKANEYVMFQDYNYGFTVELPNEFRFSINGGYATIPNFTIYEKLFQWHFWPFGDDYFENGLVVDKKKRWIKPI